MAETTVYLCTIPYLNNSYDNVIDFSSITSQREFFINKCGKRVLGNVVVDSSQTSYTLKMNYQGLDNFDYLFVIDNTKYYYYFITGKHHKTPDSCIVDLELDVWNTFLFDFDLGESLIERCHVPRWINGQINKDNISVDEGFPTYDYYVSKLVKNAYNLLEEGTNIYITSTPLNKVGVGGDNNSGGIYPDFDPTLTPVSTKCTAANGDIYTYPTTGYITAGTPSYPSGGNLTGGAFHPGIDIGAPSGEADSKLRPVYAPYVGTVIYLEEKTTGYGNNVRITCDDQGNGETYHIFAHLYKFSDIKVGDRVTKSTVLGYMGNSGNSTGKHLHWEISPNGTFNTENYITPDVDWKSKYQSEVK